MLCKQDMRTRAACAEQCWVFSELSAFSHVRGDLIDSATTPSLSSSRSGLRCGIRMHTLIPTGNQPQSVIYPALYLPDPPTLRQPTSSHNT